MRSLRTARRWSAAFALVFASALRAEEPPAPAADVPGSCVGKAHLHGLGFESNGTALGGDDAVILDLVADVVREQCAGKTVVIEGHTDVWGDPGYNRELSKRRAEAVKDYLVQRGIPAQQLLAVGLGADRPLTRDPARDAQALNRRITLRAEPNP